MFLREAEAEAAKRAISKVNRKLREVVGKNGWPVTFSFGVMTFISPPRSADEMIKKVDDLMYLSKNSWKDVIKYDVSAK